MTIKLTFADQSFPNFPCKDRRILPLVRLDLVHDQRSGHLRLGSADHAVVVRRSEQAQHGVVLWRTEHVQHARRVRRLEQRGCRMAVEQATCEESPVHTGDLINDALGVDSGSAYH